jgi:hypothetical protein
MTGSAEAKQKHKRKHNAPWMQQAIHARGLTAAETAHPRNPEKQGGCSHGLLRLRTGIAIVQRSGKGGV